MATRAELQARLDKYLAAETAILAGHQSFTVDGTTFTRAALPAIQDKIKDLESRLAFASGTMHGNAVFGRTR